MTHSFSAPGMVPEIMREIELAEVRNAAHFTRKITDRLGTGEPISPTQSELILLLHESNVAPDDLIKQFGLVMGEDDCTPEALAELEEKLDTFVEEIDKELEEGGI